MGKFRIGDRVFFAEECDPDNGVFYGMTGTVCYLPYDTDDEEIDFDDDEYNVGVSWDGKCNGHDCQGTCYARSGWNVPPSMLRHMRDNFEIEQNDIDVLIAMVVK